MTTDAWTARITVQLTDDALAERLERALGPEATREVPRARAEVSRGPPSRVAIDVRASDAGALRAAMNTYLGWVQLALATVEAARAGP